MAKDKPKSISFMPDDAEVTGLINDVVAKVVKASCEVWDRDEFGEQPAIVLHLLPEGQDDEDEAKEQKWSAGDLERLVPSDDEEFLMPAEGKSAAGLSKSSNAYLLFDSIVKAGGADLVRKATEDGISSLVGMTAHWLRKKTGRTKDDGTPLEVLCVTEIKSGAKQKAGKLAVGKVTKKAKEEDEDVPDDEAQAEEFDATEKALELVGEVLEESGGKINKQKAYDQIFRKIAKMDKAQRKEILTLLQDDDFQGSENDIFELKGSNFVAK